MSNDKRDGHTAETREGEIWQQVQLARHRERPHTLDFIRQMCTEFVELHGDRVFGDDPAMIGGVACFEDQTVVVLGHQKGANTKENVARNFGMAHPEGYRKALRLLHHAEKFGFPVLTFIDTPGAEPGMQSEERGMALAIADDLTAMLTARVPIIAVVIGEGGSGGALAIGVADRVLMLEHAIYSVASPESAASILWRNPGQAPQAAAAMRIRAADLLEFGIVDRVIPEPPGGAHTDVPALMAQVQAVVAEELAALQAPLRPHRAAGLRALLAARQAKYLRIGVYQEQGAPARPAGRKAERNGRGSGEAVPASDTTRAVPKKP